MFDLAVQGTLKSFLEHHSLKASILWYSASFMVQLSHPYMTTGKTIALTIWTFVSKVISLAFRKEVEQGKTLLCHIGQILFALSYMDVCKLTPVVLG